MYDEQKKEFYSYFKPNVPLHLLEEAWEESEIKAEEGFIDSGGLVIHALRVMADKLETYKRLTACRVHTALNSPDGLTLRLTPYNGLSAIIKEASGTYEVILTDEEKAVLISIIRKGV